MRGPGGTGKTDDGRTGKTDNRQTRKTDDRQTRKTDDRQTRKTDDRQTRKTDDRQTRKTDDRQTRKTDDRQTRKTDDRQTRKTDDRQTRKTDDRQTRKTDREDGQQADREDEAGLSGVAKPQAAPSQVAQSVSPVMREPDRTRQTYRQTAKPSSYLGDLHLPKRLALRGSSVMREQNETRAQTEESHGDQCRHQENGHIKPTTDGKGQKRGHHQTEERSASFDPAIRGGTAKPRPHLARSRRVCLLLCGNGQDRRTGGAAKPRPYMGRLAAWVSGNTRAERNESADRGEPGRSVPPPRKRPHQANHRREGAEAVTSITNNGHAAEG